MQHGMGKWLFMMALVASSAWACDDDGDVPTGTAGSGGKSEGGEGGTAGSAGLGGTGGEAAGAGGGAGTCEDDAEGCPEADACGPFPLSELCGAQPAACPSLDELDSIGHCDRGDPEVTVTSRELSCGGQVIVADYGLGKDTWGFDASGTLKYKRSDGDVVDICPNQKEVSASTVWGELPCSATGPAISLCDAGGAGGGGAGGGGAGGAAGGGGAAN
jgi:hypothetical protein